MWQLGVIYCNETIHPRILRLLSQLARRSGVNLAILRASAERSACQRSQSDCSPSQKPALIPVTRASRSAVSGVTPRLARTISFSRGNDTPNRIANADCEMPSGLRNSSRSISPGCVGGLSVGSRRWTSPFCASAAGATRLVVVRDFDFVGIAILRMKANPVLLVNADTVLTPPIATKTLQVVSGRNGELTEISNPVQLRQLPAHDGPDLARA